MSDLELHKNFYKVTNEGRNQCHEVATDKLRREAYLLETSLADGFRKGLSDAKADPAGTASRVATAAAAGFLYTKVGRAPGILSGLARATGIGVTAASAFDLANSDRLKRLGHAIGDAWTSPRHLKADRDILSLDLGRFLFDSSFLSVASYIGASSASGWRSYDLLKDKLPRLFNLNDKISHKLSDGITYRARNLRCNDWLNVEQHCDGSLALSAGGNHRLTVARDGMVTIGGKPPHHNLNTCAYSLPPRPEVGDLGNGDRVVRFANGPKLFLKSDGSAFLQSDNRLYGIAKKLPGDARTKNSLTTFWSIANDCKDSYQLEDAERDGSKKHR